jgi:hypothetical protein
VFLANTGREFPAAETILSKALAKRGVTDDSRRGAGGGARPSSAK